MLSASCASEINHKTESMQLKLIPEAKNRPLWTPDVSLRHSKVP